MDVILSTIDQALKAKGLSDAAASKLAVGHSALIKNLRMPRDGEKRYNLPALMKLAQVLDLEFYFGPQRQPATSEIHLVDGIDFAAVPIYDARLAAGPGSNNEDVEVLEMMAFRIKWLRELDVSPSNAVLVKVTGDSMEPTLQSGDLVLIDKGRRQVRTGRVYAFSEGQDARVKRLERLDTETLALRSDNPLHPLELRRGNDINMVKVIGQVMWSGHVW